MDNFKLIYKILSSLEEAMDQEKFNADCISPQVLGITQERWNKYMIMLDKAGYIEGIKVTRFVNGSISLKCDDVSITIKGLEYLAENSLMKKAYNIAKGIKEVIPVL